MRSGSPPRAPRQSARDPPPPARARRLQPIRYRGSGSGAGIAEAWKPKRCAHSGTRRDGEVRSGSAKTMSSATTLAPRSWSAVTRSATTMRGHGHWPCRNKLSSSMSTTRTEPTLGSRGERRCSVSAAKFSNRANGAGIAALSTRSTTMAPTPDEARSRPSLDRSWRSDERFRHRPAVSPSGFRRPSQADADKRLRMRIDGEEGSISFAWLKHLSATGF